MYVYMAPFINRPASHVAGLLVLIDVPHDVIGQPVHAVAGAPRHLGEALRLGLVFERVAWEVYAWTSY
jgi:hypothetical protein